MLKASVVIPTKNPGTIFIKVIENVINQKTDWDFEVLVIDSGSNDGTIELCQKYQDIIKLKKIPSEEFGHGKTRNLGISISKGEFVALITHDAMPCNEYWLQNLVRSVEQREDIAGAFGRHLPYPDCNPFVARDLKLHFDGFCQHDPIVKLDNSERYKHDLGYKQFLHFFSDNNACIRRSIWEKIPYPDVDFAEDQIWAKTVIEAGYAKAYANDACVFHSHNYSPWEYLQRSFDEAKAFKNLFDYNLCPSIKHLIYRFGRMSKSDLIFAYRNHLINNPWFYKIIPINFMRQLGYYLGQNSDKLATSSSKVLSLDHQLKKS